MGEEKEEEKEEAELITSSNGTDKPILLSRGIGACQPQPRKPLSEKEVLDDTEASRDGTDADREANIVVDADVSDEQARHASALLVTARTKLFLSEIGYCRDKLLALTQRQPRV